MATTPNMSMLHPNKENLGIPHLWDVAYSVGQWNIDDVGNNLVARMALEGIALLVAKVSYKQNSSTNERTVEQYRLYKRRIRQGNYKSFTMVIRS
jgi:hypothetical protein